MFQSTSAQTRHVPNCIYHTKSLSPDYLLKIIKIVDYASVAIFS